MDEYKSTEIHIGHGGQIQELTRVHISNFQLDVQQIDQTVNHRNFVTGEITESPELKPQ